MSETLISSAREKENCGHCVIVWTEKSSKYIETARPDAPRIALEADGQTLLVFDSMSAKRYALPSVNELAALTDVSDVLRMHIQGG